MSWTPGVPVHLETPRYRLRTLTDADATERYLSWMHDQEVMRYLVARNETHTRDSLLEYIRKHDGVSSFLLGIFDREEGIHVGNFSIRTLFGTKTARQGVLIGDRRHWGRGAVLETRAALLDFLFGPAGLEQVEGAVFSTHAASLFNYQAQGWRMEGRLPDRVTWEGREIEVLLFAMRRDDWRARRGIDE